MPITQPSSDSAKAVGAWMPGDPLWRMTMVGEQLGDGIAVDMSTMDDAPAAMRHLMGLHRGAFSHFRIEPL